MPEAPSISAPQEVAASPREPCEQLDPRIRRTRELLSQALGKLLETKEFDRISIQDITDEATVNRATFYAHYPDKFALLECMVASRFHQLLDERKVVFTGECVSAIFSIILGVCDFLVPNPGSTCEHQPQRQMEPHVEAAIVAVVQQMLLHGLRQHPGTSIATPEMLSATASWAIYGASRQWSQTAGRAPSEAIAATILRLVAPLLMGQPAQAPESPEHPSHP